MASLSTLPPEILNEIVEQLFMLVQYDSKALNSLSLAEKKFYPSVKKRMLKYLFLDVQKAEKAVIFFIKNPQLASMVNEIRMYCNQFSEFAEWAETGGPQIVDTLELGTFNQIIELTPNLKVLEINNCEELIRQQSEDLQLATLNKVTSIKLDYGYSSPSSGDPITQFIDSVSTPQIEQFTLALHGHLLGSRPSKFTISTFPIRHLKVSSFSREGSLLQLPIESYVGLQTMVLDCDVTMDSLTEVIEVCGSTLKVLKLRSSDSTPYSYISFAKLLPQLTIIKELAMWRVQDLPEDFFQHLPSTITRLEVLLLQPQHLAHLQNHPRPALQLKEIYIDRSIVADVLHLLPHSVVKLELADTRGLKARTILQSLASRTIPTLLNTITYHYKLATQAFENQDKTVEGLKKLGIKLVVIDEYPDDFL